ncbi:sugar kinase [Cyanobium sp. ATX 6E8]|uniref:FGGY-family carbohydrate kinase n=1 Tax=Cyanobium sp. ATX 6E8 TaxID=2823701 RepID=UPI0020CD7472|nr:FGGY-family carbohydrate kinase [Cyanobium sp. ATX 6E8]MCP9943383.1 sugar kinase [Cyanobium sp. ATX 6E8]
MTALALGVDLGSSGLRIALVEPGGAKLLEETSPYPTRLEDPWSWVNGLELLCARLPSALRSRVGTIAIAGTSGTLLLCRPDGQPGPGALGLALPYHHCCTEQAAAAAALAGGGPAASASGSLARALHLLAQAEHSGEAGPWLLRHQADWLMGWLMGNWRRGEEGNNLRLGWDLQRQRWSGAIDLQPWASGLPEICASGTVLDALAAGPAQRLGLPSHSQVVAGSTDANAGVLAAEPLSGDGITVLGTTLVLKQFSPKPIEGAGISCHRVAGRWLVGGASNAGAGILRRFFSDGQIAELSRQIDPSQPTGLRLRPLPARGERFPVDDPNLEPVLEPRPISDGRYLQALLEGLTAIEQAGWQRLRAAGAPPLERVITLGGGARNPQWRQLRQQSLGVPVLNRPGLSAALGMARLAATILAPP